MSHDETVVQKQEELVEHREQEATVTLDEYQSGQDSPEKLGDIEGRLILGDVLTFRKTCSRRSSILNKGCLESSGEEPKDSGYCPLVRRKKPYTKLKKRTWMSNTGGKKRIPLEFV